MGLNALDQPLDGWLPVVERLLLKDVDALPAALKPAPIGPSVGQHDGPQPAPAGEMDQGCVNTGHQAVGTKPVGGVDKTAKLAGR